MKRAICYALTVLMLLSLTACGQGDRAEDGKVTIYIPDTETVQTSDETVRETFTYTFEEGWENKESFSVTKAAEGYLEDEKQLIYGDKCITEEVLGAQRRVTSYDEYGRAVSVVDEVPLADSGDTPGYVITTVYSYDEHGRKLSMQYSIMLNGEDQGSNTAVYTYTDTADGSEGVCIDGTRTLVLIYDNNYRLVCEVTLFDSEDELYRTEYAYDAYGNIISEVVTSGEVQYEIKHTYKAVKVSEETAARLPQFNRGG